MYRYFTTNHIFILLGQEYAMPNKVPPDIEIAQSAKLKHITKIAKEAGIYEDELELYGKYKAKVRLSVLDRLKDRKQGKPVPDIKNLKGHIVYTTLEPCAQCSGMMVLLNVYRTVYGQTDPGFGKAIERLKLDSSSLPHGYKPYPRPVISDKCHMLLFENLDHAYKVFYSEYSITDFLKTDEANKFFHIANILFDRYETKFDKNKDFLRHTKTFVKNVPSDFTPLKPDI